jgi:hypothetical protein
MRRAITPALLIALAGCGGGSGSGSLEPSTPTTVGEAAGCTVKPYQSGEMFVKEAGKCQIDGQEVTIYTFGDAEGRDGWLDVATTFGGVFLVGEGNWIITGPRAALEVAQDKAGGEIQ